MRCLRRSRRSGGLMKPYLFKRSRSRRLGLPNQSVRQSPRHRLLWDYCFRGDSPIPMGLAAMHRVQPPKSASLEQPAKPA
ncbi:MAG: hypothetical protein KatS3mg110_4492 [Pirellulaceae bacterium]|nr:MAG: hypothetical protein KatS3mg110_4492 [Pirellulaceae bacterium]